MLLGAWWIGAEPFALRPLFAAAAALALATFANSYNDAHDVDIDRIAHPERPLPRGAVTREQAIALARVAAVVSVALSAAAALALGALSVVVLAAMRMYSRAIKRHGLAGNLVVAVLASLPFLYGAWAGGRPHAAWPLVVLAVPLHLAREIAKDIDDRAADLPARRTLPGVHGLGVARAAFAATLVLFFGVLALFARRHALLAPLLAAAILLTLAGAWCALAGRRGGPLLLKSAMVCAMASLLGARAG